MIQEGRSELVPQRHGHFLVFTMILAGLLLFAAFVIADGLGINETLDVSIDDDVIRVDKSALDFGEVWADPQFKWSIPVENISDHIVEIESVNASCSCVSIKTPFLIIPAHRTVPIELVIDLTDGKRDQPENSSYGFEVKLRTMTKGNKPPYVWRIRGNVRRVLSTVPSELFFEKGELVRGMTPEGRRLVARSFLRLNDLIATYPTKYLSVTVTPRKDNSDFFDIDIIPTEALLENPQPFSMEIVLHPVSGTPLPLPDFHIPVKGEVVDDISVSPYYLHLGAVVPDNIAGGTVTLNSKSGKPFEVSSVVTKAKELTVVPYEQSPVPEIVSRHVYHIHQRALYLGHHTNIVSFFVHSPHNSELDPIEVILRVSYLGVDQVLGVPKLTDSQPSSEKGF